MVVAFKLTAALVACILSSALAGCATMPSTSAQGAIKSFYCGNDAQPGAYVPVRWSKSDTDETIAQTKANNAVHKEICR